MNAIDTQNKQNGLTLIELMIALVLGLLLVAGTIQVFISNKQTHRVTEAHSRLQENARFALDILTRDIRSAGYTGCRAIEKMNNVHVIAAAPVPASMDSATIITGSEAGTGSNRSPAVPASVNAKDGTDTITLQRGVSCGATLVGNVTPSDTNVQVAPTNTCSLKADDILMISDCQDGHIFRASSVSKVTGGTAKETITYAISTNEANKFCTQYPSPMAAGACSPTSTAKTYGYDSEILRFSALTYFIAPGENGLPSLWVYDHTESPSPSLNPLELIEGIENLQIEYGSDDNDDYIVDRYIDAKTVNDNALWGQVESARISILAQTIESNLTTSDQNVTYNGATVSGVDGRIRRVFTSTIAIRNRAQ